MAVQKVCFQINYRELQIQYEGKSNKNHYTEIILNEEENLEKELIWEY